MKLPSLLCITLFITHTPSQCQTDDSQLVQQLLNEDLGTRSFAFCTIVKSASGREVMEFNHSVSAHTESLAAIESAAKAVKKLLNAPSSPTIGLRRINECSRHVENMLKDELNKNPDFTCSIPLNSKGKAQRTGYPDLKLEHKPSGLVIYLDPKLYEDKSRASSFRSFYFEPRTRTLKIQHNAIHLLLGFPHDGNAPNWKFGTPEIVDLSKLRVRLKAEFQASNRSIYRDKAIISSEDPSIQGSSRK